MDLIIVDCQNDFISGALACKNADNAVHDMAQFLNTHPELKVFYTGDWHGDKHCSFLENGGIWPKHCVAHTSGAELSRVFFDLEHKKQIPNEKNFFKKATEDHKDEYSAFFAKNAFGKELHLQVDKKVLICGIASEFCVKETAEQFFKMGYHVSVIKDLLGYVNFENHEQTMKELADQGINVISRGDYV